MTFDKMTMFDLLICKQVVLKKFQQFKYGHIELFITHLFIINKNKQSQENRKKSLMNEK